MPFDEAATDMPENLVPIIRHVSFENQREKLLD